ncbi:MAG: hypothetical protein WCF92_02025 [bacterium]
MISKESLRKFVGIYKKCFGDELTEESVEIVAEALLGIYKLVYTTEEGMYEKF